MNTSFVFDRMQKATKSAFDKVGKVAGISADADLNLYNKLKPEDFGQIVNKFGADQALAYIKEMEHRRATTGG